MCILLSDLGVVTVKDPYCIEFVVTVDEIFYHLLKSPLVKVLIFS